MQLESYSFVTKKCLREPLPPEADQRKGFTTLHSARWILAGIAVTTYIVAHSINARFDRFGTVPYTPLYQHNLQYHVRLYKLFNQKLIKLS